LLNKTTKNTHSIEQYFFVIKQVDKIK